MLQYLKLSERRLCREIKGWIRVLSDGRNRMELFRGAAKGEERAFADAVLALEHDGNRRLTVGCTFG